MVAGALVVNDAEMPVWRADQRHQSLNSIAIRGPETRLTQAAAVLDRSWEYSLASGKRVLGVAGLPLVQDVRPSLRPQVILGADIAPR